VARLGGDSTTGVKIDEEGDGRVNVASADEGAAARAIAMIQALTATPELNKSYVGRVERITDFGKREHSVEWLAVTVSRLRRPLQ
jgi:polyribonucleotide nucleotidyltransferase